MNVSQLGSVRKLLTPATPTKSTEDVAPITENRNKVNQQQPEKSDSDEEEADGVNYFMTDSHDDFSENQELHSGSSRSESYDDFQSANSEYEDGGKEDEHVPSAYEASDVDSEYSQGEQHGQSSDEDVQFLCEQESDAHSSVKVDENDDGVLSEDDRDLSLALDEVETNLTIDNGAKEMDTSSALTSFEVTLTKEQWMKIFTPKDFETDGGKYRWYEMKTRVYGDTLQAAFTTKNKFCVLSFSRASVREPYQDTRAFMQCYGKCKGAECKVVYAFTVQYPPPSELDSVVLDIHMTKRGKIKHLLNENLHRPLAGER